MKIKKLIIRVNPYRDMVTFEKNSTIIISSNK
jgi:hypothetical protein